MERTYWETEFVNKRKENIHVHEGGKILCIVPPGESRFVESFDPRTTYAKWYRITFKNKGEVKLEENSVWRFPYPAGTLMLELLNEDGCITEAVYIDDKRWDCYPKIPRYVPVSIGSRWAFFEKVSYCQQEEKVKDGDYFKTIKKLVWVKEPRSRREVKDIEKRLLDEAIAKTKAEVQAKFPKSADTEANGI